MRQCRGVCVGVVPLYCYCFAGPFLLLLLSLLSLLLLSLLWCCRCMCCRCRCSCDVVVLSHYVIAVTCKLWELERPADDNNLSCCLRLCVVAVLPLMLC